MPYKCCISQCTPPKGTILHKFPKDAELCKSWCEAIGRPRSYDKGVDFVRRYYRICDLHFDENAKFVRHHNRTNLKVGSIPSMYLPDVDIIQLEEPSTSAGITATILEFSKRERMEQEDEFTELFQESKVLTRTTENQEKDTNTSEMDQIKQFLLEMKMDLKINNEEIKRNNQEMEKLKGELKKSNLEIRMLKENARKKEVEWKKEKNQIWERMGELERTIGNQECDKNKNNTRPET